VDKILSLVDGPGPTARDTIFFEELEFESFVAIPNGCVKCAIVGGMPFAIASVPVGHDGVRTDFVISSDAHFPGPPKAVSSTRQSATRDSQGIIELSRCHLQAVVVRIDIGVEINSQYHAVPHIL